MVQEWYEVNREDSPERDANELTHLEYAFNRLIDGLNIIFLSMAQRLDSLDASAAAATTPGFSPGTTLTISSGSISVVGINSFRYPFVDTEALASTDDLTNIYGGNANELLLVRSTHNSHDVTLKNGTSLEIGADFTLNDTSDTMLLICKEENIWMQVARTSNA